jgi:hypothetical protein
MLEVHNRSQLFIRSQNETLPVVAMRVGNPDCSPRDAKSRLPRRKSTGFVTRVNIDAELQDHQTDQTKNEDGVHFYV